jgi:two-component system chemotaxis response regulator CheY
MAIILYVEDNAEHRLMMHTLLTSRGFDVELGRNGVEGIELAKEANPDLILLDLYMPKMDGFTMLEHLNEDSAIKDIPVIVVSAWPTGDHRRRAFDGGARAFVEKPYEPETLIKLIKENLTMRA